MKKFSNKKKIIVGSIIGVLIGTLVSVSYAFFTYANPGLTSQLVAGEIYMKYAESSNTINFTDAMPRLTYVANQYFEFDIVGKNTNTEKDIIYDIVLSYGEEHSTRNTRIRDDLLKFRLVTVSNNVETEIFNNQSYNSINNRRIHAATIPRNTTNVATTKYRLYAWISNDTVIGNVNQDYTETEWEDVYASIKVNVTGDFTAKELPTAVRTKIATLATANPSYIKSYNSTKGDANFTTQDTVGTNASKQDVYYYTGANAKENGNVLFGGYCWQIIRTTDTGGLRLIYNGPAENNQCLTSRANGKGINGSKGTQKTTMTSATVYGTGFSYDLNNNTFTLTGTSELTGKTWASNASELIGTYTCLDDNTTCSTLYYVGHKQSDTEASTASYTIGDNASYSQIGKSAYNAFYDSPALVGYMYNKVYAYKTEEAGVGDYANSVIGYNGTNYVLSSDTNSSVDATHHYRCYDASCTKVMYYYYTGKYVILENGDIDPLYVMINKKKQNENTDANINVYSSAIKGLIDNWYKQNIVGTSAEGKIDNSAVYCNDRSTTEINGWDKDTAITNSTTIKFKHNITNNDLNCINETDRFSKENTKAGLTYPVGVITEPEINLMNSGYAASGQNYWGASPSCFNKDFAYLRYVYFSGATYYNGVNSDALGARPVVSLRPDAEISGGNGTYLSPFTIS